MRSPGWALPTAPRATYCYALAHPRGHLGLPSGLGKLGAEASSSQKPGALGLMWSLPPTPPCVETNTRGLVSFAPEAVP